MNNNEQNTQKEVKLTIYKWEVPGMVAVKLALLPDSAKGYNSGIKGGSFTTIFR
jgi:hypothetical protein